MLYLNDKISQTTPTQLELILGQLPQWRRQAALRFKHHQGRAECALAYMELCRGLRAEYGIGQMPDFNYQEGGKPLLRHLPHIHFSLSHCRAAVGCLLHTSPCGLDIEYIRPASPELVRYTMNADECQQVLGSANPNVAFTRLWTQKEAVFKHLGTGITDNVRGILSLAAARGIKVETRVDEEGGFVVSTAF